jgi:LuxR family transcriptional regulator, maltose regulon positive regulatory protein
MRLLIADFRLQIEKRSRNAVGESMEEMKAYTAQLLAAFSESPDALVPKSKIIKLQSEILPQPLSQRELKILQLIAQGLSNREIGERLFLALDTVKGHNRKIFDKLQVQSRTEAIARARELGLL